MLQYIIDAYKEKIKVRNKEEGYSKKMKISNKILLFMMIAILLSSIILFALDKFNFSLILLICLCFIMSIFVFSSTKQRRVNWNYNIQDYNVRLDTLKEVLAEKKINYYSKYKIKKLIVQCEKSINIVVSKKEKARGNSRNLIEKYIFPIITFGAGALNGQLKLEEIMRLCIGAILIIILADFFGQLFNLILDIAEGNKIEERENILVMLEDLLIRDFEPADEVVK